MSMCVESDLCDGGQTSQYPMQTQFRIAVDSYHGIITLLSHSIECLARMNLYTCRPVTHMHTY